MTALDLVLLCAALAAGAQGSQPEAPVPIAAPLRELPWGQLNFLHTTDTHGWHGGHLQEPSYSADWGDYISFASHLRARADADGSDLLLVDTGDRVEGNGLYDASEPKGKYTFDIFKQQDIDLICSGNHELYQANSSNNEFYQTIPNFKGKYLASNLDIYNPETGALEELAPRFKKFTTKNQGIRILAFGFLYDFNGNANNTVVHKVEDTTKEKWFQDAIRDREVDLIVVIGHVGIRSKEFQHLYKVISDVQWDVPIQFFGGHTHIRDFAKYDRKSTALESGRYMETIGFMSISNLKTGGKSTPKDPKSISSSAKSPNFSRRYIDNNLFSFYHHASKNDTTFPTDLGRNVTANITSARKALKLDSRHGCAPQSLWVNRAPYPGNQSIFTWLENSVLPTQLAASTRIAEEQKKALVLSNTGAMRFDIFEGPFTKDSTFLVSPFTSGFKYLADVPFDKASKVLTLLNNEGPILDMIQKQQLFLAPPEQIGRQTDGTQADVVPQNPSIFARLGSQIPLGGNSNKGDEQPPLTPGYTTKDDAGSDGDDTLHEKIAFYEVPNCIQTPLGFATSDPAPPAVVDVVYNEFIESWVLLALQYLDMKVSVSDSKPWMEGKSFTDVMTDWISGNWKCD